MVGGLVAAAQESIGSHEAALKQRAEQAGAKEAEAKRVVAKAKQATTQSATEVSAATASHHQLQKECQRLQGVRCWGVVASARGAPRCLAWGSTAWRGVAHGVA